MARDLKNIFDPSISTGLMLRLSDMKQENIMIIITLMDSLLASHSPEKENKVTRDGFIYDLLVLRDVMELGKLSEVVDLPTTVQCEQFN